MFDYKAKHEDLGDSRSSAEDAMSDYRTEHEAMEKDSSPSRLIGRLSPVSRSETSYIVFVLLPSPSAYVVLLLHTRGTHR